MLCCPSQSKDIIDPNYLVYKIALYLCTPVPTLETFIKKISIKLFHYQVGLLKKERRKNNSYHDYTKLRNV